MVFTNRDVAVEYLEHSVEEGGATILKLFEKARRKDAPSEIKLNTIDLMVNPQAGTVTVQSVLCDFDDETFMQSEFIDLIHAARRRSRFKGR